MLPFLFSAFAETHISVLTNKESLIPHTLFWFQKELTTLVCLAQMETRPCFAALVLWTVLTRTAVPVWGGRWDVHDKLTIPPTAVGQTIAVTKVCESPRSSQVLKHK